MASNDEDEVELHPDLIKILDKLNKSRRDLLKDKAYEHAPQQRQWTAQHLVPIILEAFEFFGMAYEDSFGFSSSNVSEIRRLRKVMMANFAKLGVKREDLVGAEAEEEELADNLQEAFHSLLNLLDKKLPGDTDIQKALDTLDGVIDEVVEELAPSYSDEDDDDDDDDDEPGDDEPEVIVDGVEPAPEN